MRVFLSSTAEDLATYRKVADDTILRLSQESVVMERFGPMPDEPVTECERKARESDVVVCLVAHRYGCVPEKGRGSITQREVEAAKTAGKDVLAWIVADDHPWTQKREQDLLTDPTVHTDPRRVAEVAEGVQALVNFKAWLRETFVCDTFTTPDDLGRKLAVALSMYSQRRSSFTGRSSTPATRMPPPFRVQLGGHGEALRYLTVVNDRPNPEAFTLRAFVTDVREWSSPWNNGPEAWARLRPFYPNFKRHELEPFGGSDFSYTTEDVFFDFAVSSDGYKTLDFAGKTLSHAGHWRVTLSFELNGQEAWTEDVCFEWSPGQVP